MRGIVITLACFYLSLPVWSQVKQSNSSKEQKSNNPTITEPLPELDSKDITIETKSIETKEISSNEVFTVVEEIPSFPNGTDAMMKFIAKNVKYPESAKKQKIKGKSFERFTINTDGTISDVVVLKPLAGCPECDQEAIRVIKSMPKWKPGKQNGLPVATYFNVGISFEP